MKLRLLAPGAFALALPWIGCSDDPTPALLVDGGTSGDAGDAAPAKFDAALPDPIEAGGILGRRLGDRGCDGDEDCDSAHCFMDANDSWCTNLCAKATEKTDCPSPLAGLCNRQGSCDRAR